MENNNRYILNIIYIFFEDDFYKWPIRPIIEALASVDKRMAVIGITYPVSVGTIVTNPMRFLKFMLKNNRRIGRNIYSFTPFGVLPLSLIRGRFLIKMHTLLFAWQINGYLNKINAIKNRITWVADLKACPVFINAISGARLIVYHCHDEYTMKDDVVIERLKTVENEILKRADVVFANSNYLCNTRSEKNKNCFCVENGVDFDFFKNASSANTEVDKELKNIARPIVGYSGNTRSWLDFDLLEYLADNLQDVSFAFVGPVAKDAAKNVRLLKKRPNVYFLGNRARAMIPGVLKGFDVCLIPFKFSKFNLATNPLKFWEYLAAGKPILSLRIPDLEKYEDVASFYIGKEEALQKLRLLLNERNTDLQKRRMEIARENSRTSRSRQYYDILTKYLDEKYGYKK